MYTTNLKQINLPQPPHSIIEQVLVTANQIIDGTIDGKDQKQWLAQLPTSQMTPANDIVQEWGKKNIGPNFFWMVHVIHGSCPMHKDAVTIGKLNYIVATGGDNVLTGFYDDDKQFIESVRCELNTWYQINAQVYHDVANVDPGTKRIILAARTIP